MREGKERQADWIVTDVLQGTLQGDEGSPRACLRPLS